MSTIKTEDGSELYFEFYEGDHNAPTLIFIHGWCSNLNDWKFQKSEFVNNHPLLLIDRRGHGRSTSSGIPHSTHQHASDFFLIAKELGIEDAITICHAGGTPGALRFVAEHPGHSKALIIVDSSPTAAANLKTPTRQPDLAYRSFRDIILDDEHEKNFQELYKSFFEKNADASMVMEVVEQAVKTPIKVRLSEIENMAENQLETSNSITQPVLVIASPWMDNISSSFVDLNHLKLCFNDVQLARPIGCGHFPQMEVPNQVNAFIKDFLTNLIA
ncbi:MAG: alpha/beta fold hydrolase [Pseudohongiellaceae bacterium]